MNCSPLNTPVDAMLIGQRMHALITDLYPICRSITGNGVRRTLETVRGIVPIEIHEVPSGLKVFDWTVPKEWNIRDAYVKNAQGDKVIDFTRSNLHVLNYSVPVKKSVSLGELKEHLYSLPDRPDWIPYKTSYYRENWGFCLRHNDLLALNEGEYEVCIDSTLESGSLSYGELFLRGEEEGEVLVSCHVCHPSLANDNLSGVSLACLLAERIAAGPHRFSYRFLFIPGTIGAITWLSLNEKTLARVRHGLVLTGLGDPGRITYKKSRSGLAEIDLAACHLARHAGEPYDVEEFSPYGYDERQYCSPGINLPVGRLSRTPFGRYPQYHSSADDLTFVRPEYLGDSFCRAFDLLQLLEQNHVYLSLNLKCEAQLGKRGLYDAMGAGELALLWVMNLSDGSKTLLDIAERSGMQFALVAQAARLLEANGLLQRLSVPRAPGPEATGV